VKDAAARYTLHLKRSAERDLDRMPEMLYERMAAAILGLETQAHPPGCKKLRGAADLYRVRVGSYRIVYTVNDAKRALDILAVRHRRETYRSL
jgi:mRNA interferase RelE/StbE